MKQSKEVKTTYDRIKEGISIVYLQRVVYETVLLYDYRNSICECYN